MTRHSWLRPLVVSSFGALSFAVIWSACASASLNDDSKGTPKNILINGSGTALLLIDPPQATIATPLGSPASKTFSVKLQAAGGGTTTDLSS